MSAITTNSMASSAGVFFLLVSFAGIAFMSWFLMGLVRERKGRRACQIQVRVNSTELQEQQAGFQWQFPLRSGQVSSIVPGIVAARRTMIIGAGKSERALSRPKAGSF